MALFTQTQYKLRRYYHSAIKRIDSTRRNQKKNIISRIKNLKMKKTYVSYKHLNWKSVSSPKRKREK